MDYVGTKHGPKVRVVAVTQFLALPDEVGAPREDQDQGTDAERLIELAGRECYDSYGKGRDSAGYHRHITEVDHGSVMEHGSVTFRIWDVSRGCTHELVRHRVGVAISQRSTRYVDESESRWMVHPLLRQMLESDPDRDEYAGLRVRIGAQMDTARNLYTDIVEALGAYLQERGVDGLTARKQARGAARGFLGNALSTSLIWTVNYRTLRNTILRQRANAAADAEIRLLANACWEAALPWCPAYLADLERVECPDGIGFALGPRR